MGNLMSGSTSYKMLANKYGNFYVPAYRIKVAGTDLVAKLGLSIVEMTVTLSLNAASAVVVKLGDLYDKKSQAFDSAVKNKFKLGTVVEVELGYLSDTTCVFKGYVSGLGMDIEEQPLLVVQMMDARRLMMSSGKSQLLHDVKNYSDAFKAVVSKYSKLCTAEVDATDDKLEKPIAQTTNDYQFITRELLKTGKAEREFFILTDKAYFRKPAKVTAPIMSVRYGRELLHFSMMSAYLHMEVQVSGYDPKAQMAVSASKTVKSAESQSAVLSKPPTFLYVDADADSADKAKTRAAAIAERERRAAQTGSGVLIGMPEIVPGRFLKVEDLDSLADRKLYLTEVTHTISKELFVTNFEVGGWDK